MKYFTIKHAFSILRVVMRNIMFRWIDQIGRMDKVVGPGCEYAVMGFMKTAGLLEFMQKLMV